AGRNKNLAIGNASIDQELGDNPSVNENQQSTTAALDAKSIESESAMIVELQQSAETPIARRVRPEGGDVMLGNCGYFFDKNVFAGNRRGHGSGKNASIVFISLRVHPHRAMFRFG